jgi:hypothetical protein
LYDYLTRERRAFGLTAAKPLCQFDAFASAIKARGFDDALHSELGIPPNAGIIELLDAISNRIARSMRGKPKACFSKSVKETLYTTVAEAEDGDENFKSCISEFVRREGTGRLVQGLFQFYVFNTIWWKVEDRLREAEGGESLEEARRTIELLCSAAVAQVLREWQKSEQTRELLTPELARDFLLQIQSRLGELCSPKVSIAKISVSHDTTMPP